MQKVLHIDHGCGGNIERTGNIALQTYGTLTVKRITFRFVDVFVSMRTPRIMTPF